jgi:hypothetical protein
VVQVKVAKRHQPIGIVKPIGRDRSGKLVVTQVKVIQMIKIEMVRDRASEAVVLQREPF